MKYHVYRFLTNIQHEGKYLSPSAIKLQSYLMTLWSYGKYQDYILPSNKELCEATGIGKNNINKILDELKGFKLEDRFKLTTGLLVIRSKSMNGYNTKVYSVSVPEFGELTDPSAFSRKGGGDAMMEELGGYYDVDDDIQRLGLSAQQELILALLRHISKDKHKILYNYKVAHVRGYFECMSEQSLEATMKRLKAAGYFKPSKPVKQGRYWGWERLCVELDGKHTAQEDDMKEENNDAITSDGKEGDMKEPTKSDEPEATVGEEKSYDERYPAMRAFMETVEKESAENRREQITEQSEEINQSEEERINLILDAI